MQTYIRHMLYRHGVLALAAVMLLPLCLSACSDQVLHEGNGTYVIIDGTGVIAGGTGAVGLQTESTTGGSISIQPTGDPYENAEHVLRADFLSVGDADCTLLRVDDTVILVDAGETNDYNTITEKLGEHGITTIDHFIITHYDNDHIGSAARVLENYDVTTVYMPAYIRDSRLYRDLDDVLGILSAEGKVDVRRLTEDVRIDLGYGSLWINPTALYKPELTLGSDESHALQENNYSLITSVYFGEINLLLTGDAEGERMAEFAALLPDDAPKYDILKIPHHGGYDKELGDFLREAKGELRYSIVSVGSTELVEASLVTAMRSAGSAIYYTCDGHIAIATDGTTMTVARG